MSANDFGLTLVLIEGGQLELKRLICLVSSTGTYNSELITHTRIRNRLASFQHKNLINSIVRPSGLQVFRVLY